ncbi:MAG: M3 family oligoendopeptidase, partial [Spirochaetota bacterium]
RMGMQAGIKNIDATALPLWDLNPIYKGFNDAAYTTGKDHLNKLIDTFLKLAGDRGKAEQRPGDWIKNCIDCYNTTADLFEDLSAYAYMRYSTNTQDKEALKEINVLEHAGVPLKEARVLFRNNLSAIRESLFRIFDEYPELKLYRFFIEEELFYQGKQMSPGEESLAADLSRSGGEAWSRLQEAISSTLSVIWDETTGEEKTVTDLRNLADHTDRATREKAFRKEVEAWKRMEIPLAFSLNGVKGFSITLNKRRKYPSTLERSIHQARISGKVLDSLITVMKDSRPIFRKYLKAKAQLLGLDKLAFFDIFAPAGTHNRLWPFDKAKDFIIARFNDFSKELRDFAEQAFNKQWIDARPHSGKVGGAYCISLPLTKESRILCNYNGSFSSIMTLAHELGHAYHHHILKDASYIHRDYPMTLAETASIFAETIVFDGALLAAGARERLSILEIFLQDTTQVIIDILSRYIFENALFEKRKDGELTPDELCDLMIEAQKETYGDAVCEKELHPYMWAVKGHYYRPDLAFYNFPYAFGQLFGLGLYSQYKSTGSSFSREYRRLLEMTGKATAIEVTKAAGFDIETPEFWQSGIEFIKARVEDFCTTLKGG